MVDFIAFAVIINLLMSALIYTIRHSIPIRTPVLIIASLMSLLFCSIYPYMASIFVFPKVIYSYVLLVLAGAVLLYFIERIFFAPEDLVKLSEPVVMGQALTVLETPSPVVPAYSLLQIPSGMEIVAETVLTSEREILSENGIFTINSQVLPLAPFAEMTVSELCATADEVPGYVPEDALEDIKKDIYEETEKIAADIEKEILFVLENEYNRNMEDAVEEAASAMFYEQYDQTETGDFLFYNPWEDEGEGSIVIDLPGGTGPDEDVEENTGESQKDEESPLNEGYLSEKEQLLIETAGEEAPAEGESGVNGLVEAAFDKKSAGDLSSAVGTFMRVLKLSPPPRLAMLVCLEMSAIYRDIGQREQAVAVLDMFLARWGSNFSTDVMGTILSSIKELKGESR
ncbi:MAG: hypothetical protein VR69_17015 [Peptococcaceae bacterium BRH_c4b]|nr:MAG: hypothetical protein VR69_17015 [Peptococcaceae bacterium BRH_c4b]